MKYFRVKIGYGKDDFISVDEDEVGAAVRAQVTGRVLVAKEGSVAGNHIMSITPDFNRALGLNRDYVLTGEDYKLLGDEEIQAHRMVLQEANTAALGGSRPTALGRGKV